MRAPARASESLHRCNSPRVKSEALNTKPGLETFRRSRARFAAACRRGSPAGPGWSPSNPA
ncbi:hypothetical protein ACFPRL_11260 [Pseudoclavibacter helvolus]